MTNIVTYPTNPVQGQEFTVGETIKIWDGEKWVNKTPTNNPHNVTKDQVGLGDVDNVSAANLRDRGTHTGTQSLSTISDAGSAASKDVGTANGVASLDGSGKVPDSESQVPSGVIKAQLIGQGLSGNYGFFEEGFNYTVEGDIGIDADGNSWIYVGAGAPNKVVDAGTVPSVGAGYQQVTFNAASGIIDSSGSNVQDFIDASKVQGIMPWDEDITYPVNGLAKGSDGQIYKALVEQNGNDPVSGGGVNWVRLMDLIGDLSQDYTFKTVSEYKASDIAFPVGKRIFLRDRNDYFIVVSGTANANEANIISNTEVGQSLSLIVEDVIDIRSWGGDPMGVTSVTSILHIISEYLRSGGQAREVDFGCGSYLVTPELDPYQSPNTKENVTWSLPYGVTVKGGGRANCIIFIEYPNKGTSSNTDSRFFILHEGGFETFGIQYKGDQLRENFQFFPLNNGNSVIGAAYRNATFIDSESIHDCRFTDIPGFYSGTSIVNSAFFTNNIVEFCGNGYNVSGRNITVSNNYFESSEGVESSGADIDYEFSQKLGGKIKVNNNIFYNCSIGASLGGNISAALEARSESYSFVGNLVQTEENFTHASAAVIITNNADRVSVDSDIVGSFSSACVVLTTGGQPLSPTCQAQVKGNLKNHSGELMSLSPSDESVVSISGVDGDCGIKTAIKVGGSGTINVRNSSFVARFLLGYITNNTCKVNLCPYTIDRISDRPNSFTSGAAAISDSTLGALTARSAFKNIIEAKAERINNVILTEASQFNEDQAVFSMFGDGTMKFGDGISNTDCGIGRKDTGTIGVDGNLNISNIPTSSAGLSSGDLWSDAGVLKIIP